MAPGVIEVPKDCESLIYAHTLVYSLGATNAEDVARADNETSDDTARMVQPAAVEQWLRELRGGGQHSRGSTGHSHSLLNRWLFCALKNIARPVLTMPTV